VAFSFSFVGSNVGIALLLVPEVVLDGVTCDDDDDDDDILSATPAEEARVSILLLLLLLPRLLLRLLLLWSDCGVLRAVLVAVLLMSLLVKGKRRLQAPLLNKQ
jgi:hypothetical protein